MRDCAVIALGGNAILGSKEKGTVEEQTLNIARTAKAILEVAGEGKRIVITHGNGPQIGAILLQNEAAKGSVPPMPVDVCVAESQGMLGYLIEKALRNEASRGKRQIEIATILTQTQVHEDDPDFDAPSKPIGPFYERPEARKLMQGRGYKMIEDARRGWRRVVPSPAALRVVEAPAIEKLVEAGFIVIANGGGGVPVVEHAGQIHGVEAVVDKDLSSQKLASEIHASTLLLLTDVKRVYLNYGRVDETPLEEMNIIEAETYLDAGHFLRGSMEPKVRAAIQFVKAGGTLAGIGALEDASDMITGKAGTRIVRAH